MAGHSKWATTKHKKAALDAKRGKLFAKLVKNIEVAARMGGPDPAGNPTLFDAIQKAKKTSVPNDNIDRAVSEVRLAFNRNGGNMADSGSVAYLFERKGVVTVTKGEHSEDDLLEVVLDAGAEEINDEGEAFEILSEATDVVAVRTALQEAGVDYDSAEAQFVPTMRTPVDLDGAHKALRLIEALEDSDDVQNVYSNLDIPDDVAAQLADADEE